jgi:hypothetical protein
MRLLERNPTLAVEQALEILKVVPNHPATLFPSKISAIAGLPGVCGMALTPGCAGGADDEAHAESRSNAAIAVRMTRSLRWSMV